MQIFIHRNDQDYGPYSVEEVQIHLASGQLLAEDHAWYEGAPDWMPLEEIPGVAQAEAQPNAAPPKRNHTGLPVWIPPRRTEDPELASSSTSFATPAQRPRPPIGITSGPPATGKPVKATPIATPRSTMGERPEPVLPAPPAHNDFAADESPMPVPGMTRSLRAVAIRNMIFGALWCVGGAVVTYVSYETALAQAHGGAYLVTGGAIVFGFIRFLRGLVLFTKS